METEILIARINDVVDICERTSKHRFLGFLSREEAAFTKKILKKRNIDFSLWGGYQDASRVMLGCFPDWNKDKEFPIVAITFNYRKNDILSHRDFLGAFISLGIKRETVGDILVEKGRAVAFVTKDISDFLINQIDKIGRVGVDSKIGFNLPLPQGDVFSEFVATIASERIDCVVSALCNISRNLASEKIALGLVSVNSVIVDKVTKTVSEQDTVTVRGKGKFIISSLEGRSKKNRIILKYKKYL